MIRLETDQTSDPYKEYCCSGGGLTKQFFCQAQEFLADGQNLGRETQPFCRAAQNYAQRAGLRLGLMQARLYAYLRIMMPPKLPPSKNGSDEKAKNPWFLCDQELVAETLLLTGDQRAHEQFTRFFSNIFPEAFDPEK